MKKTISVRVYRHHDLDLITMKMDKDYHLGREMKRALIARALNEPYVAPIFARKTEPVGNVSKSMLIHIHFDALKKDEEAVLELLSSVKSGIRCGYIKAVFRSACVELPLEGFYNGTVLTLKNNSEKQELKLGNEPIRVERKKEYRELDHIQEKNAPQLDRVSDNCSGFAKRGNTSLKDNGNRTEIKEENLTDFDQLFGALDQLGHQ